jgi:MFS family permease
MRQSPTIKLVYFSMLLFVLLGVAVVVLLIPIIQTAKDDLGLGVGTKGVGFLGAVGSVGLVISSLVYGLIGRRIRKRNVLLGGFAIMGVFGMLIAVSESLLFTLLLAFLTGLVLSPIYIVQDTMLHETVPEEARGRIFSVREWFMNVSAALWAVILGQIVLFFPKWKAVLFQLPLGIQLDDRRLLLLAVGLLVTFLSLGAFFMTRKSKIA